MLILKEIESRDPNCLPARRVGGNRKRRTWTICPVCLTVFLLQRLDRRFCSYACKVKAQTTGCRTLRRTLAKARSAHSLLRYHVQAGHIVRPIICEECGVADRPIEGAHYDYNEPLRVRWLCRSCHVRWDKREPKHATVIVARPNRNQGASPEKTPAVVAGVGAEGN